MTRFERFFFGKNAQKSTFSLIAFLTLVFLAHMFCIIRHCEFLPRVSQRFFSRAILKRKLFGEDDLKSRAEFRLTLSPIYKKKKLVSKRRHEKKFV